MIRVRVPYPVATQPFERAMLVAPMQGPSTHVMVALAVYHTGPVGALFRIMQPLQDPAIIQVEFITKQDAIVGAGNRPVNDRSDQLRLQR